MVLVGNKIDLTREVSKDEGLKVAKSFNIPFFEVSAKNDQGIQDFMKKIISDVLYDIQIKDESIKLVTSSITNQQKSCNC